MGRRRTAARRGFVELHDFANGDMYGIRVGAAAEAEGELGEHDKEELTFQI